MQTFSKTASSCFSLLQSAKTNGTSLFIICETRFKLTAFPSLSSKKDFARKRINGRIIIAKSNSGNDNITQLFPNFGNDFKFYGIHASK